MTTLLSDIMAESLKKHIKQSTMKPIYVLYPAQWELLIVPDPAIEIVREGYAVSRINDAQYLLHPE